ncbi:uncharacterized protein BCR38DRAFT_356187 [Pseudomassariella vexata]|uniref:Zn(2)-C6 fungal-type domain-containing protein n=1 Tax=Pseudomassariella vexata TaxID=1141098 RepID=A0A1Y2DA50_9PEZI|nr:uncharacterized protein BCR38DRAFT_356187 [Pseudomassariella vexata]ORY56142.1 hypothetical protein BCR38DRAFT_356187 [Pseudomassariella vexata]
MAEAGSTHSDDESHDGSHAPARKRQRVRLSCLECRRRKLSCSRELPCDRCIKSGTPERCNYESRPGSTSESIGERTSHIFPASVHPSQTDIRRTAVALSRELPRRDIDTARDHERIRKLELEVAHLRGALAKQTSLDGSTVIGASPSTLRDAAKETPPEPLDVQGPPFLQPGRGDGLEFKFIRGNNFKTRYFGPHNAWSSFRELTGLTPFMKDTAEEWLRPLNIAKKDRKKRKHDREMQFLEPDPELEALLPSKVETDALVAVYLDQFEQLHRIIHIPTFKKQYEKFWDLSQPRCAAITAFILAMIAVSSCLDMQASSKFVGLKSRSYQTAEKWIKASDAWLERQSQKHRRLLHYQLTCMLYLAKRVNVVKKKRYWTSAGAMIRDAIIVGLHQDPEAVSSSITPYNREMRRRLWATMIEFDVQASFDQGVPTLLSQIYNETKTPRNIDDDGFDEDSEDLPPSKPSTEYTFSSYQHIARRSLQLRLELNQLLTGPVVNLDWEQVTHYADMITQEIDALPAWDLGSEKGSHKPLMALTLLHVQLKQYLLSLHQPYLKLRQYNSKYQIAEFIYFNAARDMVLMHDKLFQMGIRALYFLREDTMNAAINLCNVSLHQPRGSTSLIGSYAGDTLKMIEKCIAIKEDRILRCGNNDPWGYSSMCAAFGLLETHLGVKNSEAARASAAERFIGLHYKLLAYQIPPYPSTEPQPEANTPQVGVAQDPINRPKSVTPFPLDANTAMQLGNTPFQREGLPLSMPWLLPSTDPSQMMTPNPDMNLEGLGMDLNELWGGGWDGGEFY